MTKKAYIKEYGSKMRDKPKGKVIDLEGYRRMKLTREILKRTIADVKSF
jgi:hypothetical protein